MRTIFIAATLFLASCSGDKKAEIEKTKAEIKATEEIRETATQALQKSREANEYESSRRLIFRDSIRAQRKLDSLKERLQELE